MIRRKNRKRDNPSLVLAAQEGADLDLAREVQDHVLVQGLAAVLSQGLVAVLGLGPVQGAGLHAEEVQLLNLRLFWLIN